MDTKGLTQEEADKKKKFTKNILVISSNKTNWFHIFEGVTTIDIDGVTYDLHMDQAGWDEISLTAYSDSGVVVELAPAEEPIPGTLQHKNRTLKPDFLIIRNVVKSIPQNDYKNLLLGFMHSNVPSLNSLQSIYCHLERPIMYGGLLEIQKRLGVKEFPLIQQNFYPYAKSMNITPNYPIVVKVAHLHSSLGKVRLKEHSDFEDFASVMCLHPDYCTAEHFYNGEYDLRIQKIGDHVRVLKRTGFGQWKTNRGSAVLEDVPVTPQYLKWIEEASKAFGGTDMCALDAIHTTDGEEYILELNDGSIGLSPEHEYEDSIRIRDLALLRMKQHYSKTTVAVPKSGPSLEEWQIERLNLTNEIASSQTKIAKQEEELDEIDQRWSRRLAAEKKLRGTIDYKSVVIGAVGMAAVGLVGWYCLMKFIFSH